MKLLKLLKEIEYQSEDPQATVKKLRMLKWYKTVFLPGTKAYRQELIKLIKNKDFVYQDKIQKGLSIKYDSATAQEEVKILKYIEQNPEITLPDGSKATVRPHTTTSFNPYAGRRVDVLRIKIESPKLNKKFMKFTMAEEPFVYVYIKKSKGDLTLYNTRLEDLNPVTEVNGDLWIRGYDASLNSLIPLRIVRGDVHLQEVNQLKSLDTLEEIHGDLTVKNCKDLTDLGKLRLVKGEMTLENTGINLTEDQIRSQVEVLGWLGIY
jgi:ribosomal protein L30/L7E